MFTFLPEGEPFLSPLNQMQKNEYIQTNSARTELWNKYLPIKNNLFLYLFYSFIFVIGIHSCKTEQILRKKTLLSLFMDGFNFLKARATPRRQFTLYH